MRLLTSRAVRMRRLSSGAPATMNQGSTAMQWPPTPGPGRRMSTRGWRLASLIAAQTSTSSSLADHRQFVGEGDVDVAIGVLDQLDEFRRPGVGQIAPPDDEAAVDLARSPTARLGHAADNAIVGDQLAQHPAGKNAFRTMGDMHVDRRLVVFEPRKAQIRPGRRERRRQGLGAANRRSRLENDQRTGAQARRDRARGGLDIAHVRLLAVDEGRRNADDEDIGVDGLRTGRASAGC